jgi:hypothetical protein
MRKQSLVALVGGAAKAKLIATSAIIVLASVVTPARSFPVGGFGHVGPVGGTDFARTDALAAVRTRALIEQTMPICIAAPQEMQAPSASGQAPFPMGIGRIAVPQYSISITVQAVPASGGYVQVGCDRPDLLQSPSGTWPFHLAFPASGGSAQSFLVSPRTVDSCTTVHIYGCEEGADISNPSAWRVIATVNLQPAG